MLYEIFYRPLFNALFFIYDALPYKDLGLAIILLTVLVRVVLYPVFHKSVKNQTIMQKLQPKIKEIQNKHKDDREKQTKETMALYSEHNVSPFSGILFLIIQLPIFIGLYKVFSQKFTGEALGALYGFINKPEIINYHFLGLINLYESSIVLVILAALLQFLQGYMGQPPKSTGGETSTMEQVGRQMVFMAPLLTVLILWRLPSAVGLYWAVTSLFSVFQQFLVNKQLNSNG